MEGFTVGQIMQVGAWGIGLGSLFFTSFGIKAGKDFFLVLGLVCCIFGDFGFAVFLADQTTGDYEPEVDSGEGPFSWLPVRTNETAVTVYILLGIAACYGLYVQLGLYKAEGCGDEDDEDDDEEEEADERLAAGGAQGQMKSQQKAVTAASKEYTPSKPNTQLVKRKNK